MGSFIPLLLVVVVFVLLIIVPYRRQAARQRSVQAMQASLEPGTQVMTTAGIYGTVVSVGEKSVELEVAPGTVIRIARAAIGELAQSEGGLYAPEGAAGEIESSDEDEMATDEDETESEEWDEDGAESGEADEDDTEDEAGPEGHRPGGGTAS